MWSWHPMLVWVNIFCSYIFPVMNRLRILARKSGIGGSLIPVLVKKKQQCIGIENKCFATMSSVSTLTDWKNSLPARYGVASQTVDVVSEPSMMYNLMMVRNPSMVTFTISRVVNGVRLVTRFKDFRGQNAQLYETIWHDYWQCSVWVGVRRILRSRWWYHISLQIGDK